MVVTELHVDNSLETFIILLIKLNIHTYHAIVNSITDICQNQRKPINKQANAYIHTMLQVIFNG